MQRISREQSDWEKEIRAIYAELENRGFERSCINRTQCCQFRVTGRTPSLTLGEALFLWKGLRASGRKTAPPSLDGNCPLLNASTGRCMAYAHRPFGCRTHFCTAAGGPLARKEVVDLIHRLEMLDALLGGDGGRRIEHVLRSEGRSG